MVDGMFFRFAALVHPATGRPTVRLGIACWSCALTLSGSYEQLFTYVMFSAVVFNVLAGLAIFRLRRTPISPARIAPGATQSSRSCSWLARWGSW